MRVEVPGPGTTIAPLQKSSVSQYLPSTPPFQTKLTRFQDACRFRLGGWMCPNAKEPGPSRFCEDRECTTNLALSAPVSRAGKADSSVRPSMPCRELQPPPTTRRYQPGLGLLPETYGAHSAGLAFLHHLTSQWTANMGPQ